MTDANLTLNVKMMNTTLKIVVPSSSTVLDVKRKLQAEVKAEPSEQKLIYKGILLSTSRSHP